ncbi:hypothetical protein NMG60_11009391 [Bertholletia excelsa]
MGNRDPGKREENTGSGGVMRILRAVGVAAVGVAAVGGALLLAGAMLSSGGSGKLDDDGKKKKKMMIAPGTNGEKEMPREDFEDDTRGYFRRLRGKD